MPANRATTARIISAYSIGIRWRASLLGISLRKRCLLGPREISPQAPISWGYAKYAIRSRFGPSYNVAGASAGT